MNFRTALKHLEKLGEVNFEEFAEATDIPRHNASVYLSRLFKMGLASRRKDRRYGKEYPRKPYLYQISEKKGNRYLKYEETTEASLKRHYDGEFKRETKYLDLLRVRKKIRDIGKELAEPEPEKKIPYVTRDGVMLHLTPAEFLEWTKFEEEQRIAEKEREERKAERKRQEEERKRQEEERSEERKRQEEERRQREAELETQEELVECVIGEGSTAKTIMVRPETVPFLIQAQSKKDYKPHEVKEKFHEDLKEQQNQANQFQTQMSDLQKELDKLKAQAAVDPLDRLFEQKDKLERLGIIPPSKEKQMQSEYGSKGIKIFDREHRKGPVRKNLLPCNTSLRPRDILNTNFTYEQALKEDETLRYEPSHVGALFPRPLRSILGRLF